jgi:hypothetical protein
MISSCISSSLIRCFRVFSTLYHCFYIIFQYVKELRISLFFDMLQLPYSSLFSFLLLAVSVALWRVSESNRKVLKLYPLISPVQGNYKNTNIRPNDLPTQFLSRKEVFQPHLPVRLPCYDLAPVTGFTLGRSLRSRTSGTPNFHGLTGGVYKARERIHRAIADARLLANPTS